MNSILIYGSREFAANTKEIAAECGHKVAGFIDDFNAGENILGTFSEVQVSYGPADYSIAIAIGSDDLAARWAVYDKVLKAGYQCPPLIHPASYVDRTASVSNGAIIFPGCVVGYRSTIDELAVLNHAAVVSHDCNVGQNVFVCPNASICGFSKVGRDSFVGAGVVVVGPVTVAAGSFIKAGSVFSRSSPTVKKLTPEDKQKD